MNKTTQWTFCALTIALCIGVGIGIGGRFSPEKQSDPAPSDSLILTPPEGKIITLGAPVHVGTYVHFEANSKLLLPLKYEGPIELTQEIRIGKRHFVLSVQKNHVKSPILWITGDYSAMTIFGINCFPTWISDSNPESASDIEFYKFIFALEGHNSPSQAPIDTTPDES